MSSCKMRQLHPCHRMTYQDELVYFQCVQEESNVLSECVNIIASVGMVRFAVGRNGQRYGRCIPYPAGREELGRCRPNPDNAAESRSRPQNHFCVGMCPPFLLMKNQWPI